MTGLTVGQLVEYPMLGKGVVYGHIYLIHEPDAHFKVRRVMIRRGTSNGVSFNTLAETLVRPVTDNKAIERWLDHE